MNVDDGKTKKKEKKPVKWWKYLLGICLVCLVVGCVAMAYAYYYKDKVPVEPISEYQDECEEESTETVSDCEEDECEEEPTESVSDCEEDECEEDGVNREEFEYMRLDKPVIYLYPEETMLVDVSLKLKNAELSCTYPKYDNGWRVTAEPDGTLYDADGMSYNYLYWEAVSDMDFDFSSGYCVRGTDTAKFLEIKLADLGLARSEANEFIVYWLPKLEQNKYNVISFQRDVYTDSAELNVSPEPDTLLRVYMAYYGSDKFVDIAEPELEQAPVREGFVVIEWGGSEVMAENISMK